MIRDGRLLFAGTLNEDNIEHVQEHLNTVLAGKRFTMVTANEAYGWKPEVRPGVTLREGAVTIAGDRDDRAGRRLRLDDDDYLTSLWASDQASIAIHERRVIVDRQAPVGNHIWWVWAVNDDEPDQRVHQRCARAGARLPRGRMMKTLPDHTPTVDMLVMTYGEPDDISGDGGMTNRQRVEDAHAALAAYLPLVVTGPGVKLEDLDENWENGEADGLLSDLVTDLLHLATFTGLDPDEIIRKARRDFTAEVGLGYEQ